MAAGITFRIGGALDPSYRGALAQSVAEARAAGVEVNAMQIAQLRAYQATATRINNAIALERLAIFAGKGNSGNLIALQNSAERQATRIANLQTAISIGSFSDYKRIKDARIAGDKAELVSATENLIAQEKAAANYYLNRTLMSSKMRKSLTADNRAIAAAEALWMGQDNGAGIQTSKADLLPLRNELARAIKAKRAPAQAAAQAERWATALAIAQGGGSGVSAGGSHGRRGIAGIIRESTVIGREVMMGRGGGRIAGSVTLLADYMGVLDKAVKSTASPALKAANAASVLSKEMHKAALAAQGTAEGAKLLADAEKQETVAAELATKAKIALANANVTLSATFFGVVGAVVVAAVVIGAIIYSYHKAAVAAKNLADALNPLKQKYTELAEAQDKAAKAAKENADWITNLNNKHESESSQLERKIKLLKEEQAARRRVAEARGASDAELQALDIANLKQEKAMLEVQQKRLETENASAQAAEQAASKAAIAGTTTTDEKGRVINLDQAQSNAKKRGEILDAAQDALDKGTFYSNEVDHYQQTGQIATPVYKRRAGNDNDVVDFKVGDKPFSMSVEEARKNFDFMSAQAKKLAEDQAHLDDVLKNTKSTAQEKMDAQNRVNEDLENVNSELGIATNDPRGRHGGGGRSATERERLGIGAPQVANLQKQTLDVSKLQLSEMQKLNANVSKLIASGNGASNPDGW